MDSVGGTVRHRPWMRAASTAGVCALVVATGSAVCPAPALAAAPTSVVVAAAGDIACDPADANFSGSNTSTCRRTATH